MHRLALLVVLASPAAGAQPSSPSEPTTHRLGVQGHFGIGPIAHFGGSVRYEHSRYKVVGRLAGAHGAALEDEGNGFDAALAHVGLTTGGVFYFFAEAGGTVIRTRMGVDDDGPYGGGLKVFPSVAAGFGGRIGGDIHLGVAGWFPMAGVGLYVGLDFAHW